MKSSLGRGATGLVLAISTLCVGPVGALAVVDGLRWTLGALGRAVRPLR